MWSAARAWRRRCAARRPATTTPASSPGTTARQRVALRGRTSYAAGTRFVHDRTAAEAALALANEMSIDRAARELGVSKQALRRAFDHHGLPQPQVFQGGPKRSRFYEDRTVAEQAWRRAAEVGINQTRKELGVSDRALRTAWQRHGLGLPPRPAAAVVGTRRLDAAFVTLNRKLLPVRARSDEELAARVRRAEEYAALGADVVVEMGSETHGKRPAAARGRSPAAPSAPMTAAATASTAATAGRPTVPAAPTAPAVHHPKTGRWWPMPADRL
jgi:hypothetical protein